MSEARSTSHRASYRRSAREPSMAPSARTGGWAGSSPTHHGQGSTSPAGRAGEVRSPRTFSITTRQGRRASTARATCSHRPERVPGASPARRPATETSLTREAGGEHAHPRHGRPADGGDVAEVGDVRPVAGEDAAGARVGLGVPGHGAAEHLLYGEFQAAVAGAQRADRGSGGRWGRHVSGPSPGSGPRGQEQWLRRALVKVRGSGMSGRGRR
jgi:hypothetical protein